jgi:hypothetical protein
VAGYGLSPTNPRVPSFSLSCPLTPRRLRVLHDKKKPGDLSPQAHVGLWHISDLARCLV